VNSAAVARLANVSQSAVSRAFTPGASVSEDTRTRVLEAAAQLGYRPNALARAMISGKSHLIAVLVAYLDNQFYPVILEKLSRALQKKGYHVLLMMTETGNQDELIRQILQYQVEGIVLASATLSSNLAEECAKTGVPVVLFNRYSPVAPVSSVTSDNIEGGRLAAEHLIEQGCRHIAYIAGFEDSSTNRDREAGFFRGLASHGLTCHARLIGGYTNEGASAAARKLMQDHPGVDGLFVANDHMAFTVMDVLRQELGLSIPDDIAIVGYDDVPQSAWAAYDLTSVEQPTGPMVDATVSMLLEQAAEKSGERGTAILPARLIVRGSSQKRSAP
jgi:DNA-binding LacI/PurR family transcriptional regulator